MGTALIIIISINGGISVFYFLRTPLPIIFKLYECSVQCGDVCMILSRKLQVEFNASQAISPHDKAVISKLKRLIIMQ